MSSIEHTFASALASHRAGQLAEAESGYRRVLAVQSAHPGALHYLGLIALQRRQIDAARDLIASSIRHDPGNAESHYHLGLACGMSGRIAEAAEHNRRAIALRPDYAEAHMNLGNALKELGQSDEAIASYLRCLALQPAIPEAHFNLANMLAVKRDHDGAIASYRRALQLRPQYAEAHHNLGTSLLARARIEEAMAHFSAAIGLRRDFPDPLVGLALALMGKGDSAAALDPVCRALAIRADVNTRSVFIDCVTSVPDLPDTGSLRQLVATAIKERWCRPAILSSVAASLIKRQAPFAAAIAALTTSKNEDVAPLLAADVAQDNLVRSVLDIMPVCDGDLERLLTAQRRHLLHRVHGGDDLDAPALETAALIAHQCFINEYVYAVGGDEIAAAAAIWERLDHALDGTVIPASLVALTAAYFPLYSLTHAETLLEKRFDPPVDALITRQIAEPLEERRARAHMPRLTPVEDDISQRVREQYEESPYPRWIATSIAPQPLTLDTYLRKRFPLVALHDLPQGPQLDVLIAGCGTGQHPIEVARLYRGARVLAIDLSLSSLCYAQRKAREMGADNIEFAQADILKLGDVSRSFDLIESAGVLHHLSDPFAGWRALVRLLRPGGLMRIALYSEIGRADVKAAQAMVAAGRYAPALPDIRRFRSFLAMQDDSLPAKHVTLSPDWFTASGCRDLLFHVQEHRLTLPRIGQFLAEANLAFLGFDTKPQVRGRYAARFPDDPAGTDLDNWHQFEIDNPLTFSGMYQFWLQARSA